MNTVRWNIAVSPDTDQSVRMFLAGQGGGKGGQRHMSEADLTDLVDEAVQWTRKH